MRNYLLIVFVLITNVIVNAQPAQISGRVIDGETGESLPYAQFVLYELEDSTYYDGTITGDDGRFILNKVEDNTYAADVSFIGYKTWSVSPIEIGSNSTILSLGDIRLDLNTTELEEVRVIGQVSSTSRSIDKQVYKADQFLNATGGTAIDLLQNIPSVNISPDGEVSLRGTSGFLVYLNGKPTQLDASVLLSQISANSIDRIEIISVPTAQYDSQGKGGIINVTTRKSTLEGTFLNAGAMVGGSQWNEKADPLRYGGNFSFTHNRDRFKLYGGLDYNNRDVRGSREGKARLLQDDGSYYWMVADGPRPEWHINWSGRLGTDIELTDKDAISIGFYHGKKIEGRTAEYLYDNFYGDIDENRFDDPRNRVIFNPNTHERVGNFATASFEYVHQSMNGGTFTGSFLYESSDLYSNLENIDFSTEAATNGDTLLAYRQFDDNPLNGYRIELNYTHPFSSAHVISFGYQPQYLNQTGSFEYDTLDVFNNEWNPYTEFENQTELKRWIHAGYVNFTGSFDQFEYIAGLRLEYTDQLFHVENPDYLNIFERPTTSEHIVHKLDLFPVMHLQYNFNETDHLIAAYSKRINRPPSKNMAPFLLRRHYEVFLVGDPSLKPEYSNLVELSFVKGIGESGLTFTGFYRGTNNAIYRVNTVLNEDESEWYHGNSVLIRSYTNAGNNRALGGEVAADLKLLPWWKMYLGGSLYHFTIQGEIFEFDVDQQSTNWSLNANTTFSIAKQFRLFWSLSVKSATVTAQGGDELFYISDASFSWKPKKAENLNVMFKVVDMFSSNDMGLYTQGYDRTGTELFHQATTYHRYGPILELNLTWSLNSSAMKKKELDSEFGKDEF